MREIALGQFSNFIDAIVKSSSKKPAVIAFWILLFIGAFVSTRFLNTAETAGLTISQKPQQIKITIPLNCSAYEPTRTCPSNYPTTHAPGSRDLSRPPPAATCPDYFRWIHEDLRPWAHTGITRDMVDRAGRTANFRLVVVNGKAYVETFRKAFQTRDVFTLWGILQLLRWYPGRVPDLELMFDCVDWPVVFSKAHTGSNTTSPPPVFRYCGDDESLDVVFPDWSFWGWPEINIKPWVELEKELSEGNKMRKWDDREPYAYWKGNPEVAETRKDLLKCNVSDTQEWNARVYRQDWGKESREGYNHSNLANQCVHKYKIYIEGSAWSVSEKYILACDSPTLLVKPRYYDFFTRGLEPLKHYWPIKENDKCRSIKFAVDWGNTHKEEAQAMGKASSEFIREEVKMEYVYDYMYHLLNEYSKLLRFKPVVPRRAVAFCSESMACGARGAKKDFMVRSMVTSPSEREPCSMPPPYNTSSLYSILRAKTETTKKVELWQNKYWENQTNRE